MKRGFLLSIREFLARRSKKPWCVFETPGPDPEGRLAFTIYYNKAFINNLVRQGLSGITEEETVQMFFLQLRMVPEGMIPEEDIISPEDNPMLTQESARFVRG